MKMKAQKDIPRTEATSVGPLLSLTVTISKPSKWLSPNARPHWAAKARAVKAQREEACFAAAAQIIMQPYALPPRWKSAVVDILWFGRRCDRDNAISSTKAARDGLQDAGLIANDSGLRIGKVEFGQAKGKPRVELTVTRIADAEIPQIQSQRRRGHSARRQGLDNHQAG